MSEPAVAADDVTIERPWATPRQDPVNGIVQPRVIAPFGKPVRHTNKLDYILNTVLKEAQKHKHSWPFVKPVDALTLGIPLYHERIKRPMDLKTVETRIKSIYYTCAQEAIEDIETIFNNCYSFNGPEDDVTIMAQNVHAVVKKSLESGPKEEVDAELSVGKKKKAKGSELSRLAAGSEDRKRKEGSVRMSEPPSETGSETSEKTVAERKMGSKTMKTAAAKRKADSDDDEKIEPIRPHKREASSKKAHTVVVAQKMRFCQRLLTDFYSKKYYDLAWPFYEPVNAEALGLHDYHKIISHPMDMGTIKKKLESGEYTEPPQFEHDFRLMLNNCILYNPIGDPIHTMGTKFMEVFDKKWREVSGGLSITDVVDREREKEEKKSSSNGNGSSASAALNVSNGGSVTHPTSSSSANATGASSSSKTPKVSHVAPMPSLKNLDGSGSGTSAGGVTASGGTSSTSSSAASSAKKQMAEGGKAKTEDLMRLDNALSMVQEKEEKLKRELKEVEEMKQKVLSAKRARLSTSAERFPDHLLAQVRVLCQSNNMDEALATINGGGAKGSTAKANGRPKKVTELGYEFDSDNEDSTCEMSYEDKRSLSMLINRLPPAHLSTIVTIIERREKLPRSLDDTEIEIDFEALSTLCLREMEAFARYNLNLPPKSGGTGETSSSTQDKNSKILKETVEKQPTLTSSSATGAGAVPAVTSAGQTTPATVGTGSSNIADKKKKMFTVSESSDSDMNRHHHKKDNNKEEMSGTSSSSSDDDSEDDFRATTKRKQTQGREWMNNSRPPGGGMGGQPPMSRVPPPLPPRQTPMASSSSSSSGASGASASSSGAGGGGGSTNQVLKNSSSSKLGKVATSGATPPILGQAANPGFSILDTLLPPIQTPSDGMMREEKQQQQQQQPPSGDYEDEEARIERKRREARLAREQEDENSMAMTTQMEIMNNFENHNLY